MSTSTASTRLPRKRKASALKEDVPAKLPKCSPRTSKIRRDAFFAGARRRSEIHREPLSEVSSAIANELPSSPSNCPLSSPLPLFSSSPLKTQLLTPASTPDVTFLKRLQIAKAESGNDNLHFATSSRLMEDFQDIRKPRIRKPMPTSFSFQNLNRSLVGYEPDGMRGIRLGKRHWMTEGFYSERDDTNLYTNPPAGTQMPFCLATFNTSPMVAVGYESGAIRFLGTGPWDKDSVLAKGGFTYYGFNKESASVQIHENAIFDLSLSADDRYIASASGDQTCHVHDVENQKPIAILTGHRGSVKQINHSLDNHNLLLTSSRDSDVHIWDLRTTGISPEDKVATQRPINSIFSGHRTGENAASVTSAVWSTRNPYQIATASHNDAIIKVWDIRKSHFLKKSANARPLVECETAKPKFHNFKPHRDHGITSLTYSPDGSRLYALCKDGNLYAYSTSHMDLGPIHFYSHSKLKTHSFYVKASISRDGALLATGSTDGTVVLFPTDEKYLSPAEDDCLPAPHGAPASVTAAKELRNGTGTALIEGHNGKEVTGVAWDVNRNVISISDDCVARIWRDDDNGARANELRSELDWSNGKRHGCGWSEGD